MDWKELIRTIAPTAVGVLATPAAGMAVKVLADALLGGSTGDHVADEAKLAGVLAGGITPDVRIKLIEAEAEVKRQAHELRKALAEQDTKRHEADARDRASARDSAVRGDTAVHVFWFTVVIFLTVASVEAAVLFNGLPKGNPELLGRILGTMDASLLAALYYTFGSSASSTRKTELMKGAL